MRRAVFAVLGTVAGTSLLVGAKLGTNPLTAPQAAAATGDVGAAGDPTATPTGSASRGPTPPAAHGGSASARPSRTGTSANPPTKTTGLTNGTFAGRAVTEKYGTVKVTITVSGGRVTDVSATYPTSPETSAKINANAVPKLRQEALAAQSAAIATVSGATYTSTAYKTSLQSALDAAHA
ncbi:MAG TPA: FMN-binding protein [Micromonosporaceae bacterium]